MGGPDGPIGKAFVSDIFHEVDEEVRREQLKKLWDRYSIYIVALAVVIVAAVGGWRAYEWYEAKKAAEAGAAFEAAIALAEQGKNAEAEAAFAKIAADGTSGYRTLARLRAAAALAQTDVKAAIKAYDDLTVDPVLDPALQDLAAVRAGLLAVDTAPFDEMRRRLTPMAEPGRPFRHTARELLALSAWHAADAASARRYIDMIAADAETPQGTRARVDVLSALLAGEGKS